MGSSAFFVEAAQLVQKFGKLAIEMAVPVRFEGSGFAVEGGGLLEVTGLLGEEFGSFSIDIGMPVGFEFYGFEIGGDSLGGLVGLFEGTSELEMGIGKVSLFCGCLRGHTQLPCTTGTHI